MTITTISILNGVLVLLTLAAVAAVSALGLRIHRADNADSVLPAGPTSIALHDELAEAA